jgi:sugar/nucleoside kinase (ribokinase family)
MAGLANTARVRSTDPLVACAGILVSDLFVPPLAELPRPGMLVSIDPPLYQSGGCAANTGLDLAALGVRVRITGRVGSDGLGRQLVDELVAGGVDTSTVTQTTTSPTSQTVALTLAGDDRRFLHCFGANAEFTAADVELGAVGADVLIVGGYLLLPNLRAEDLAPVLQRAHDAGSTVLLDVAVPLGTPNTGDRVRPLMPHVNWFLPNEDEAAVITGQATPQQQAQTLLEWGCPHVVITCGSGGALYADHEQMLRIEPLPITFVDGSGAGDAFMAGVVLGILRQWPIEDTLRYAAALGASVCRGLGCHSTLYTDAQAKEVMADVCLEVLTSS